MKKVHKYYDYKFFNYSFNELVIFPDESQNGLSRYQQLLPVQNFGECSLGEGHTPLTKATSLESKYGYSTIYIKHEELNPTGSFKDRESCLAIAIAKEKKLLEVTIASSGNAALSLAAYARKAKIRCVCFVPENTSQQKKSLIELFGARLHEVKGNYEYTYRYVADHFNLKNNLTSGICSERTEANKTIAFEIWEEIGVPDIVIVPCGNGGNIAGIWKGFSDLKKMGKTSKIPKMIAVQVKGAAPLAKALAVKKEFYILNNDIESIAEGILAEESFCSPKAIKAIQNSGGVVIEVTDQEIKMALTTVIHLESLMLEPTSAAAFAALAKLKSLNVSIDSKIVVINTGSGMKMLSEIQQNMI